jgi:hypothetical protein
MGHPAPILEQIRLRETLLTLLDNAMPACARYDYRLVGTGAALLHGVTLPAADLDILVKERQAVDAFGKALASFTCLAAPAWLPEMRQYYGNYAVNGVEVGFSTVEIDTAADTIETLGRGPWEHYTLLPCGSYHVPTVALELRLITELYRNRPERSQPIIEFMRSYGCDLDFICRGLAGAGLPQNMQDEVRSQLRDAPFKVVAGQDQ